MHYQLGTSRCRRPVGPTSASFPSWQELGDIFFGRLDRPGEKGAIG